MPAIFRSGLQIAVSSAESLQIAELEFQFRSLTHRNLMVDDLRLDGSTFLQTRRAQSVQRIRIEKDLTNPTPLPSFGPAMCSTAGVLFSEFW